VIGASSGEEGEDSEEDESY